MSGPKNTSRVPLVHQNSCFKQLYLYQLTTLPLAKVTYRRQQVLINDPVGSTPRMIPPGKISSLPTNTCPTVILSALNPIMN
jgi:hypothetical protein